MTARTCRAVVWNAVTLVGIAVPQFASADALPFLPAGDARLRHLVQLEADEGRIPLANTWPLPSLDLPTDERNSLYSFQQPGTSADAGWFVSGAKNPTQIRTFDDTPREKGEIGLQAGWAAGDYAGGVIKLSFAVKPQDDKKYRFDDTYASWRFGNWWVTLGEEQRWWGPGWDGSLILSNNARPMPAVSFDRATSEPFKSRWLSWIGPWRLTTFMGREEYQSPTFPRPMFWGLRLSARPLRDVEVGLSRTAQWCHQGVCGIRAFEDVLLGKDNGGANVSLAQQPGNQELDWDVRWHLGSWPAAIYFQEQGETADGRYPLLPRPRQTTELIGVEVWSRTTGGGGWRGFLEWAGTTCGELSTSASDSPTYDCAYTNGLVYWGYYYRNRVIGHSLQGDGRLVTVGGLYLDSGERTWELRLRNGALNRGGVSTVNTLAFVPTGLWNVEAKLDGRWGQLTYSVGVGMDALDPQGERRTHAGRVFIDVHKPW